MFSSYCIGHGKLVSGVILYKGIKAAGMHFGLKNNTAVGKLIRINFYYTDMLPVDGRMEKVQIAAIDNKIAPGLQSSISIG